MTLFLLFSSSQLFAVNLASAVHYPDGLYLLTTLTKYTSKTLTNNNEDTEIENFDLDFSQILFQPIYYHGNLVYAATIPLVKQKLGFLDSTEYGVGDSFFAMGYFLPIESINILPVLQVKLPIGNFDKDNINNIGSGAYAIQPELYINKSFGAFMLDVVGRYEINFTNSDTQIKDGNTLYLEAVLGYSITPQLMVGPSVFHLSSDNIQVNGAKIRNSKVSNLQVGGDILYTLNESTAFILNVMKDVKSKNTTKGIMTNFMLILSF